MSEKQEKIHPELQPEREAGTPPEAPRDMPEAAAEETARPPASLQEQLAAALAERDANLDRWRRAEAECENVRKRMRREVEEMRKYEALAMSRDMLPVLDNLGRAIEAVGQTHNFDQLIEGVEMVARQIGDVLAKHQVLAIDAKEQPFDSEQHEAVQQLPSAEHPPMTVIEELERGYTLHDRLVRPSKVIVSKAPE